MHSRALYTAASLQSCPYRTATTPSRGECMRSGGLRHRTSSSLSRRKTTGTLASSPIALDSRHLSTEPSPEESKPLVEAEEIDEAADPVMLSGHVGRRRSSPKPGYKGEKVEDTVKRRRYIVIGAAGVLALLWIIGSSASHLLDKLPAPPSSERVDSQEDEVGLRPFPSMPAVPPPQELSSCQPVMGKPERQYALMIDAGSTGSRIHIYEFRFCADPVNPQNTDVLPVLANEGFHQRKGGLSSFKGRPQEAADSLRTLMDEAKNAVPASEHHCTPVAVKATAGLRLLGAAESDAILRAVRRWLETEYDFPVVPGLDGVGVMEGKDEGVYAWITINYLLGLIGPRAGRAQSAAVMDLGGASTQIVFEPSFPDNQQLSPGDHVYDLTFSRKSHILYQHSHLGFGLMQARRAVHNLVAFTWMWQQRDPTIDWKDLNEAIEVPHPCLVKGGRKAVELDPPGRPTVQVTLVGTGAGFDACKRVVDVTMAKDALCKVEPCAFGGVYQPSLMTTFGSGPIYALSYFYDRIVPLGVGRDSEPFSLGDLKTLAYDVCLGPSPTVAARPATPSSGWNRFQNDPEALAELEDRPEYCLDLSFMYSLLSLGYELGDDRTLVTGKKIKDIELGWSLGAGLAMLEGSVTCRA